VRTFKCPVCHKVLCVDDGVRAYYRGTQGEGPMYLHAACLAAARADGLDIRGSRFEWSTSCEEFQMASRANTQPVGEPTHDDLEDELRRGVSESESRLAEATGLGSPNPETED